MKDNHPTRKYNDLLANAYSSFAAEVLDREPRGEEGTKADVFSRLAFAENRPTPPAFLDFLDAMQTDSRVLFGLAGKGDDTADEMWRWLALSVSGVWMARIERKAAAYRQGGLSRHAAKKSLAKAAIRPRCQSCDFPFPIPWDHFEAGLEGEFWAAAAPLLGEVTMLTCDGSSDVRGIVTSGGSGASFDLFNDGDSHRIRNVVNHPPSTTPWKFVLRRRWNWFSLPSAEGTGDTAVEAFRALLDDRATAIGTIDDHGNIVMSELSLIYSRKNHAWRPRCRRRGGMRRDYAFAELPEEAQRTIRTETTVRPELAWLADLLLAEALAA